MTQRTIPQNALDEMIRWLAQQSEPRGGNATSAGGSKEEARPLTQNKRTLHKRRVLYRLMRDFGF